MAATKTQKRVAKSVATKKHTIKSVPKLAKTIRPVQASKASKSHKRSTGSKGKKHMHTVAEKVTLRKWGNTPAVRITKEMLRASETEGLDEFDVIADPSSRSITLVFREGGKEEITDKNHWAYIPKNPDDLFELPEGEEPSRDNYPAYI